MRNSELSYSRIRGDASSKYSMMLRSGLASGTYNQLNTLSKATKNKIRSDTDALISAVDQCEKIWIGMRKNDFTSNGMLTPAMMERLFKQHEESIKELLCVQNAEELMDVLDVDKNGYINEDEQILFFSLIKERMEAVANDLVVLQEYSKYKELMREIRKLEVKITTYQDSLRKRIYSGEMKLYHEIGADKFDEFCSKYVNAFAQFDNDSLLRIEQLNQAHEDQILKLQEKLDRPESMLKIKPKKKLKELQMQEKLVSIDERVEEAQNFRRELSKLEKTEEARVQELRFKDAERQISKLQIEQSKEMDQLQRKIKNEENNLTIHMAKEYDILMKKISLHENEIKRIQGLATKYAEHKGKTEGEIKRAKHRARKQNNIIEETKKIRREDGNLDSFSPSPTNAFSKSKSPTRSKLATWTLSSLNLSALNRNVVNELKNLQKDGNTTKFYIRQQFGRDRPVNKNDIEYETGDNHHKIEKFLQNDRDLKKQTLPSLAALYDDNLNLISHAQEVTMGLADQERIANRRFIQRKIEGNDKKLSVLKL